MIIQKQLVGNVIFIHIFMLFFNLFCWIKYNKLYSNKKDVSGFQLKIVYKTGVYKYFFFWVQIIQNLILILNLITDLIENKIIVAIRDSIFNSWALPFGIMITIMYWIEISFYGEKILPNPINVKQIHYLSFLPFFNSILDLSILKHNRISINDEFLISFILVFIYILYVTYYIYFKDNVIYIFLCKKNVFLNFLIAIGFVAQCCIYFYLGSYIHNLIWT